MNPDNVTLTFRLPVKLRDQLKKQAQEQDLTISQLIRRLLPANSKPAAAARKEAVRA